MPQLFTESMNRRLTIRDRSERKLLEPADEETAVTDSADALARE
jgi:hypothetical protein